MTPVLSRGIGAVDLEVVPAEPISVRVTALGAHPGPWTVTVPTPTGDVAGTVTVAGADLLVGWATVTDQMVGRSWALNQAGRWRLGGVFRTARPGTTPGSETVAVTVSDAQTISTTVSTVEALTTVDGGTL